jgi:hypothetical protein
LNKKVIKILKERTQMKRLSAPKNITWWIALILAVVGIILFFVGTFSQFSFWLILASAVLLLLATKFKAL